MKKELLIFLYGFLIGLFINIISDLIIKLVNCGVSGLYNVGTENKTMYEMASKTKSVSKTFTPEHVPKNQSMNINKMKNSIQYE